MEEKIQNDLPKTEEATQDNNGEITVAWDDDNASALAGLKCNHGLGAITLLLIPLALLPFGLIPALIIVYVLRKICKFRFDKKTKPGSFGNGVLVLKDPAEKDLIQKIKNDFELLSMVGFWLRLILIVNLFISLICTSDHIDAIEKINTVYGTTLHNGFFETYFYFVVVGTPLEFINFLFSLFS